MSDDNEPGHGNSPAAWVAVIIMLVAFTVGTLAFWFAAEDPSLVWVVYASVVLLVIGPIAGVVLAKLGYGVGGSKYLPKAPK